MNTDPTPINWDDVKSYYLACRSYKLTAEHFGIKAASINTRAYREKWKQVTNEVSGEVSTLQNEVPDNSSEVSSEVSTLQNEVPDNSGEVSSEVSTLQNEVPDNSNEVSSEVSTLQNEVPPSFPQFPCIPNLAAQEVKFTHPWEAVIIPHDKLADKAAYRAHIENPATSDVLISGIIGTSPNLRVSQENPPARMLAVVADYDTILSPEKRVKMLAKLTTRPNFISTSYSGGTRAVWVLESPLPLPSDSSAQNKLLTLIIKDLKLKAAFGPLDENAFLKLSQYYHAGWNWQMVNEEAISEERSLLWLTEAIKKARGEKADIPIEAVAAEVMKRYPGRWRGEFTLGARGVRFWDSQADNPTAAIVAPAGMLCFTGPFAWRSWEDIFGKEFIARYKQETFGKALKECFAVNHLFYVLGMKDGLPRWQTFNRQNFESLLTHRYGLQSQGGRNGQPSEVKEAVSAVLDLNSYSVARPFIYNPATIVYYAGEHALNTSLLRVHQPDEDKGKHWGDGFPWIAAFLDSLFPDIVQRDRFICEWAYAYRNAYAGKPRNGRVTFIAGDVGVGKNFLTECLIGPSLGGYTDPSSYLLGHTRFNDSFFNVGVWVCNDTVAKGDERERQVFSATLKRMAANMEHIWEGKFKGACKIEWSGRVYITLNTDPVSMQILPDLDQSNKDKISLYRVSGPPLDDLQAPAKAKAEMGALCAYLLNLEYPEHCRDGARWGVKNYLHPDLLVEAVNSGSTASFGEILCLFCKDSFAADPSLTSLEGAATWFLQKMLEQSALKEMLRGCESPRSFGKRMAALANTGSFPVRYVRRNTERLWRVERAEFEKYTQQGSVEGEIDDEMPF